MKLALEERIRACEVENQRLRTALRRQKLLWLGILCLAAVFTTVAASSRAVSTFDSIDAKEIIVRDGKGVIRARISGEMPDAVINGKVVDRGSKAAGFMVYDKTGQERGGYVTFENGNVALTLDTRERQAALFVAGPDGGAAAEVWDKAGLVGLRVDETGARFTAVKDGKVVYQMPEVVISPEVCGAYTNPDLKLTSDERLSACKGRFSENQCNACLDRKRP
jgi:hypothetical protein